MSLIQQKFLIIFCAPYMEQTLSADVLSMHLFFDRTREIFYKNNIIVKYFYEFLDLEEQQKYINKNENFKLSISEIIKYYNDDCPKILDNICNDNKYNNSFILGFEPIGFDIILKSNIYNALKNNNIICILSVYDAHGFFYKKYPDARQDLSKLVNLELHDNLIDDRLENVDLIIGTSVKYFYNINSKYSKKCVEILYSYNEENCQLIKKNVNFENFNKRKHKILLQGSIRAYKYRALIAYIMSNNIKNIKRIKDQIIDEFEHINNFKNLIDIQPVIRYDRNNTKPEEPRGIRFIEKMNEYCAVFLIFGSFPIDFPLGKIMEIFLAGSLAIIEPKDFLKKYGLIEFEHYIPLLLDNNGKLIIDCDYYQKYLGTDEGLRIAKNGFNHIINNFGDKKIAQTYADILNNYK